MSPLATPSAGGTSAEVYVDLIPLLPVARKAMTTHSYFHVREYI
jgi:hypothetical protein